MILNPQTDPETSKYVCRNCGSEMYICKRDIIWSLCSCGKKIFNEDHWYKRQDGILDKIKD